MTSLPDLLVAVGAVLGTFLIFLASSRLLLARRTMARRTGRFLTVPRDGEGRDEALPAAPSASGGQRLLALARFHRASVPFLVLAGLLLLGSAALGWAPGLLLAAAALGVAVWQARRAGDRREVLEEQLAPALRMMAAAMESGYSVQQALERVVADSPPPICEEVAQVVRAVELGTPLQAALERMAARVGGDNFDFFATIVTVQHRVGGDLPSLLARLAESIQERLRLKAEVNALTAQARYAGIVLTVLPFAVMGLMLLLSPAYILPLFETAFGRTLLILATLLLAVGLLSIRTISRVEI